MGSSDDNLIIRAVGGDGGALARLLQREGPEVQRGLSGGIPARWRSVLSVEDVMQETYIDAFLDIRRFVPRTDGSFRAWLRTLARHNLDQALEKLGAEKRGGTWRRIQPDGGEDSLLKFHELLRGDGSTPSRRASRKEACVRLRKAIKKLPPDYRRVVEMYDLEGRPADEVAAALSLSPGAVFMRRKRAHRRLKEIMGRRSRYM